MNLAKLYIELYKTSQAYHQMKIAKHKYKIAKATKRYMDRMERLGYKLKVNR